MSVAEEKQQKAKEYALNNNILDWKVKGNRMIFYTNHPEPDRTYKITIRLDSMKEERQLLTKWSPRGNSNWRR